MHGEPLRFARPGGVECSVVGVLFLPWLAVLDEVT
jgi:hypothetical protein